MTHKKIIKCRAIEWSSWGHDGNINWNIVEEIDMGSKNKPHYAADGIKYGKARQLKIG